MSLSVACSCLSVDKLILNIFCSQLYIILTCTVQWITDHSSQSAKHLFTLARISRDNKQLVANRPQQWQVVMACGYRICNINEFWIEWSFDNGWTLFYWLFWIKATMGLQPVTCGVLDTAKCDCTVLLTIHLNARRNLLEITPTRYIHTVVNFFYYIWNRTFNYLLIITLLSSRSWQHSNMAIAALIYNRAHFASTLVLKHPVQGSGARAGKLPAPAHLVPFVAMLGRNGYYLRDGLDWLSLCLTHRNVTLFSQKCSKRQ